MISVIPFIISATYDSKTRHFTETNNNVVSYTQDKPLISCPSISTSDFSLRVWPHKIRIEYDDAFTYAVVSWESNDPATTTLDSDDGNFAHYHHNGYNFLNIKITVADGGTNCVSTHVIPFY